MKRSALASVSLLLTLSTLANTAFGVGGNFGLVDGDLGNIGNLLSRCNIGKLHLLLEGRVKEEKKEEIIS